MPEKEKRVDGVRCKRCNKDVSINVPYSVLDNVPLNEDGIKQFPFTYFGQHECGAVVAVNLDASLGNRDGDPFKRYNIPIVIGRDVEKIESKEAPVHLGNGFFKNYEPVEVKENNVICKCPESQEELYFEMKDVETALKGKRSDSGSLTIRHFGHIDVVGFKKAKDEIQCSVVSVPDESSLPEHFNYEYVSNKKEFISQLEKSVERLTNENTDLNNDINKLIKDTLDIDGQKSAKAVIDEHKKVLGKINKGMESRDAEEYTNARLLFLQQEYNESVDKLVEVGISKEDVKKIFANELELQRKKDLKVNVEKSKEFPIPFGKSKASILINRDNNVIYVLLGERDIKTDKENYETTLADRILNIYATELSNNIKNFSYKENEGVQALKDIIEEGKLGVALKGVHKEFEGIVPRFEFVCSKKQYSSLVEKIITKIADAGRTIFQPAGPKKGLTVKVTDLAAKVEDEARKQKILELSVVGGGNGALGVGEGISLNNLITANNSVSSLENEINGHNTAIANFTSQINNPGLNQSFDNVVNYIKLNLDTDGNGILSPTELAVLDTNRDNQISLSEVQAWMNANPGFRQWLQDNDPAAYKDFLQYENLEQQRVNETAGRDADLTAQQDARNLANTSAIGSLVIGAGLAVFNLGVTLNVIKKTMNYIKNEKLSVPKLRLLAATKAKSELPFGDFLQARLNPIEKKEKH